MGQVAGLERSGGSSTQRQKTTRRGREEVVYRAVAALADGTQAGNYEIRSGSRCTGHETARKMYSWGTLNAR